MTDRDNEIRQRCEAATPGPWVESSDYYVDAEEEINVCGAWNAEDAGFIAASRTDIPYLLDSKAELEKEVAAAHDREDAAYAELERLREAQRWIPVTERLPEDDLTAHRQSEPHLVFMTVMACGFYADSSEPSVSQVNRLFCCATGIEYIDNAASVLDEWYWGGAFERITHWRPLPEPPQEG